PKPTPSSSPSPKLSSGSPATVAKPRTAKPEKIPSWWKVLPPKQEEPIAPRPVRQPQQSVPPAPTPQIEPPSAAPTPPTENRLPATTLIEDPVPPNSPETTQR
ncbi:hypothetical protein IQ266_16790, partial [filamentous cyanobacterium LEGE 11480]|nr:hypothetical protein [Romeriopsis navalis LEGE 11480]